MIILMLRNLDIDRIGKVTKMIIIKDFLLQLMPMAIPIFIYFAFITEKVKNVKIEPL